ncbi:MAG: hypothetical protein ACOH10_11335 [Rhodoglobus sp.]
MSTETPAPTPTAPAPTGMGPFTSAPPAPTPAAPPAPAQETDWKAEARKHEARAKEYKGAADELTALKAAQMTDSDKAAARLAELESENLGYKTSAQIATWKADVSTETGVPIAALSGSTLEALQAHAAILKPLITKAEPPVDDGKPHVPYRDLSKVLADAPNPLPGIGTLRAAYAAKQ